MGGMLTGTPPVRRPDWDPNGNVQRAAPELTFALPETASKTPMVSPLEDAGGPPEMG